jgi:glycosyltransferase involved in cell wall biosynthesis
MNILFLSTYPLEKGPSQRFRIGLYLPELEKEGHKCTYDPFYSEAAWNILFSKGNFIRKARTLIPGYFKRTKLLFTLSQWDVIFILREVSPMGPPILAWTARYIFKKKIVFDLDDAIWIPNYTAENALFHRLKTYWKTKKTMQWSNTVVAGNKYLADYSAQYSKDVRIIPTVVNTDSIHTPSRDRAQISSLPIIGWTGSTTTLKHLQDLIPLLRSLKEEHPFKLRIIANKNPEFENIDYDFVTWSPENEIEELEKFDIGLMPLRDNEWTKGKCGFKAIQYMSLGIATILSPVGVNAEIVTQSENGLLCSTSEEWENSITLLLEDRALRLSLGLAGRQTVLQSYSVVSQRTKFLDLFKS